MDVWFILQIIAALMIGAALVALVLADRGGHVAPPDLDALAFPVWVVDGEGEVAERNVASLAFGDALPKSAGRVELGTHWAEVTVQSAEGGQVFAALPADAVVRAEGALREFRNTMVDTFAQLALGLGLFDSDGRLQLFNPAFVELCGLQVDFLARKPHLGALLDALRDRGMLPEPKDWRSWRQMMLEVPAGVAMHQETWGLPGGLTYRATVRPQMKGAFALLLEDISTEMSRSQRYRADMELSQSVIDTLAEGIAVFAQSGQLVLSNVAYSDLWGHDPGTLLGEGSIRRIAAHWRAASASSAVWSEVEEFIGTAGVRDGWEAEVRLRDGRLVACRCVPIHDGATLVAFRPLLAEGTVPASATALRNRGARFG